MITAWKFEGGKVFGLTEHGEWVQVSPPPAPKMQAGAVDWALIVLVVVSAAVGLIAFGAPEVAAFLSPL